MRVKLITYHHFFFLQENLFHLHLGRLPWFTWEYTPKQRKKHLNQSIMFERCHGGDTASDLRCANEVIEALRSGAADKDGEWGAMRQIDGIVYQNWLDFTQNWLRLICCLESLWTNSSYNKITPTLGCFFFPTRLDSDPWIFLSTFFLGSLTSTMPSKTAAGHRTLSTLCLCRCTSGVIRCNEGFVESGRGSLASPTSFGSRITGSIWL